MKLLRCAAALLAAAPAGALAQESEEPPICTDRPTKANAVCTVPAGKFQLESSFGQWSRFDGDGTKADVWQIGGSVMKYGLSDRSDLQLGFTPFVDIDSGPDQLNGIGDIMLRYKHRLTGDGAPVQVALIPFVKLPTARRGIGNRRVEGGLAVPLSLPIGGGVTATFGPEVDLLADGDGEGRHAALVNLINLSGAVAPRLTLAGELWSNFNFDPAGTVKQASADAALAYAVSERLQLDAGVNVGLTRDTADVELYVGASLRF